MEEWKGLIYQGIDLSYKMEISNFGNLRNVETKKLYSQTKNKNGYMTHCTSLGSRRNRKLLRIHVAVACMFVNNLENKPFVNHIDGVKINNNSNNLEWCTNKENIIHARDMGLLNTEQRDKSIMMQAKLTNDDVFFILENFIPRHKEFGIRAFSRKFNIAHTTIISIISNTSYKWIDRTDIVNQNITK